MTSFLNFHAAAAARGDGLCPELLAVLARTATSPHSHVTRHDGMTQSRIGQGREQVCRRVAVSAESTRTGDGAMIHAAGIGLVLLAATSSHAGTLVRNFRLAQAQTLAECVSRCDSSGFSCAMNCGLSGACVAECKTASAACKAGCSGPK
jgi:hypothetical protein